PRSGSTNSTTLAVTVADVSVLPGTLATLHTRGIIRFGPVFDQINVISVLQLSPGDTAGNQTVTFTLNGLTRTFQLDSKGNAVTSEARVHLRILKFTFSGPIAQLSVQLKGHFKDELTQNVSTDARGLPLKAALTDTFPKESYSIVAPLIFKNNVARFGFGTTLIPR
ncbi:MAG TPA: hypothetical protein VKX17_13355, partial [Planctomycetota bacterium]|nr:hypothetical protein [Planctomycetota bacterium]